MAPELVQEKPYNHSVDIWSYGIILYELFVGETPFHTDSLYSLVKKIIKNPIKYYDKMSSEFKNFLKGLLVKDPSKRMSWPDIISHPFLKASSTDLEEEKQIRNKYNKWLRQVGQWNDNFKDFRSSKIDFFQSEIFKFDETADLGFVGANPNKAGKSNKRKNIKDAEMTWANLEETMKNTIYNNHNLSSMFEKFALLVSDDSCMKSSESILKIHNVLHMLSNHQSKIFIVEKNSSKKIKKILKAKMKSKKKNFNSFNHCFLLLSYIYMNDLEDIWQFVLTELSEILVSVREPNLETSLQILKIIQELFNQLQKNFLENKDLMHELIKSKLVQLIFSKNKNIVSKEVLNSSKGRKILSRICYPMPTELLAFPILKKKNISSMNNSYSLQNLSFLSDFHDHIFSIIAKRFEDLHLIKLSDSQRNLIEDWHYLKLVTKSIKFMDNFPNKVNNTKFITNLSYLLKGVHKLSHEKQIIIFLLLIELNKQKIDKIRIGTETIFSILESNLQEKNSLLFSSVLTYFSSLMDDSKFIAQCLKEKPKNFSPVKQGPSMYFHHKMFSILRKILKLNDFKKSTFIQPQICSFGFVIFGAFDGAIKILLANLLYCSQNKDVFFDYLKGFTYFGVKEVIFNLFEKISEEFLLSMKGLVYLFSLIVELITNTKEHFLIIEDLLQESRIKIILNFLNEGLFEASKNWPKKMGGEGVFDECMCNYVLKLLELLFLGIIKNNSKQYMKLLCNQMKTFPNLMNSIINVYLQSMGISKMEPSSSYMGFSAKMENFKSTEYIRSQLLPKREKVKN